MLNVIQKNRSENCAPITLNKPTNNLKQKKNRKQEKFSVIQPISSKNKAFFESEKKSH